MALQCSRELTFVRWGTGLEQALPLPPEAERYLWMEKVLRNEEVNLADFPGLTQAIIYKYRRYLNINLDSMVADNVAVLLPIEVEYKYFYLYRS